MSKFNTHSLIEGKTRIIKKFVWLKRLEGKWKFMVNVYVLQGCSKLLSSGDNVYLCGILTYFHCL